MDATCIGLVGPAPPWAGGITRFTSDLATQLEDGRPLRWLSWRPSRRGTPPGTELDHGAVSDPRAEPVLGLLDRASWRRGGSLLHGCSTVVLTVTHPLLLLPYRTLVAAYRETGGRVVLICHNVLPHDPTPLARRLSARLLGLADAALVHAAAEARLARALCPSLPIVEAFHPATPASTWRPPPGRGQLLAFGYVRSYKGLADLLQALPMVPEAELRVVGRFWESKRRHQALARELGVAERVVFDDRYVPDAEIPEIFAACDVVVCPYRQASQSGVVQLAFAHGRPVAATAVGGLAEAVVERATGALAAPRDPGALAAAIRRTLTLPRDQTDGAIRRALEERSWAGYADLVLETARV